jgi:hypothetical protein
LDLLYDSTLPAKDCALVLDHLKGCQSCAGEWNEMEDLRTRFQAARESSPPAPDFVKGLSRALDAEDAAQGRNNIRRKRPFLSMVAAVAAVITFVCSPALQNFALATAADDLVDKIGMTGALSPVLNRDNLQAELGYEPKYLKLDRWNLEKLGVVKSGFTHIARFDFQRQSGAGVERMICYQARQGMIAARGGVTKVVGDKTVVFGSHRNYQYALWSQNGRDYLFVSQLPQSALEQIVSES